MSIADTVFTIVDTETTGLDAAKGDQLVEVAAWSIQANGLQMQAPFSTLVNPGIPIPAVTSAIHHLTQKDVADAPPPALALEELRRYCLDHNFQNRPHVIVAHNAPFDRGFLPSLHTTQDGRPMPWLCTRRLASHVFPDAPAFGNQVLRYWLPERTNTPPILDGDPVLRGLNPHRALADVIVTASNLRHLLSAYLEHFEAVFAEHWRAENGPGYDLGHDPGAAGSITLTPPPADPARPHTARPYDDPLELIAFANSPITLKTCHFGKHRGKLWTEVPSDYLRWMLTQTTDMDPDVINTAKQIIVSRLPNRVQAPV